MMLFPAQPQEIRNGWTKQKKQLLEDVGKLALLPAGAGGGSIPPGLHRHFGRRAGEGREPLKELPQHTTDSTSSAMLYLKRELPRHWRSYRNACMC